MIITALAERDIPAVTALHVRGWQWAYRGQMPDWYLDALPQTIPARVEQRRRTLLTPPPERRSWVAVIGDAVVAFADTGLSRDDGADRSTAELYAIYVDPGSARQGIGRALVAHALDDLRRRAYQRATLWVLETNSRALRFYEACGWSPDGARKADVLQGFTLHEVRYSRELHDG